MSSQPDFSSCDVNGMGVICDNGAFYGQSMSNDSAFVAVNDFYNVRSKFSPMDFPTASFTKRFPVLCSDEAKTIVSNTCQNPMKPSGYVGRDRLPQDLDTASGAYSFADLANKCGWGNDIAQKCAAVGNNAPKKNKFC